MTAQCPHPSLQVFLKLSINSVHGIGHRVRKQGWHGIYGSINAFDDQFLVVLSRSAEYIIVYLVFMPRVAYTNSQTMKIGAAQIGRYVAQAIVTAVPTAGF